VVFTTPDPSIAIFGLCTRKWGIFALVGDTISPANANLSTAFFFKSQNPRKAGTLYICHHKFSVKFCTSGHWFRLTHPSLKASSKYEVLDLTANVFSTRISDGFFVKRKYLNSLRFSLTRKTNPQKKWWILECEDLQFYKRKQFGNLAKLVSWSIVLSWIEVLCVSFSCER
jgi:hypothetical protein